MAAVPTAFRAKSAARSKTAKDTYVRARIDTSTKIAAEAALQSMGLSVSAVLRVLLNRVAADGALPFEIKTPNATTRRAMSDLRLGRGVTRVRGNAKAVMAALDADD